MEEFDTVQVISTNKYVYFKTIDIRYYYYWFDNIYSNFQSLDPWLLDFPREFDIVQVQVNPRMSQENRKITVILQSGKLRRQDRNVWVIILRPISRSTRCHEIAM